MNVLTGSKNCWNEHGNTITLFSRQFEVNWVPKSALLWCEILRLFVKTLTADDKYSDTNMQSLREKVSNAIISETKDFFWIFYCISEMCMKFGGSSKKQWEC